MEALLQHNTENRRVYADFALILRYPWPGWEKTVGDIAHELTGDHSGAAQCLHDFLHTVQEFSLEQVQESYTRAFDVAPQCIPYLSVYLFGEESYKRSELMTGLLGAYEAAGYQYENELPDHLAVVLGYAPHCGAEEWAELAHWCMPGPLGEMLRGLERAKNPYAHVLRALARVYKAHYPQEFRHV